MSRTYGGEKVPLDGERDGHDGNGHGTRKAGTREIGMGEDGSGGHAAVGSGPGEDRPPPG
ncbi:hypothetical protein [Streptosporangium longisporum]